jgi:plastocyanin
MTPVNRRSVLLGLTAAATLPALTARAATNHNVAIQSMKFAPADLRVAVGDTVTFTNMDSAPHTGSAKDGSFDTGRLSKGQSGTVKIGAAGDHAYFCKVHPNMKGVIRAG